MATAATSPTGPDVSTSSIPDLIETIRSPESPEQVLAAIGKITAHVREELKGKMRLKEVAPVIRDALETRNAVIGAIETFDDKNKEYADVEAAFLQWANDEVDAGNDEMKDAIKKYQTAGREDRMRFTQPLRDMAKGVGDLQNTLETMFTPGKDEVKAEIAERKILDAMCGALAKKCSTFNRAAVTEYLTTGDESKLEELRTSLAGMNPAEIERIAAQLQRSRILISVARAKKNVERSGAAEALMKAASGVDVDVDGDKWLEKLLADQPHKPCVYHVHADTGTKSLIYVDKDGKVDLRNFVAPARYGKIENKEQALAMLHAESDWSDDRYPNANPLFVHAYNESEMTAAFAQLAKIGGGFSCKVRVNGHYDHASFVSEGGKIRYDKAPADAPAIEEVLEKPAKFIDPMTMYFTMDAVADDASA